VLTSEKGASVVRRAALTVASMVLAAVLLSACSSSSDGPSVAQVAATTPAPPPPPPPGRQAKSAVTAYYNAVNADRFGAAWSHFSPELRRSQGGFYQWRAGYDSTTATTLLSARTVRATSTSAIERIRLIGDAIDACGNDISQTFVGTWTLEKRGGAFVGVALDVSQVGGDELITDPAACASEPSTPVEPAPPSDAGCDPNYVGECVPADASDVDCAGGDGDGPEYVGPVQVVGSDPYDLDRDGDGYACES
jgi:hypothetical protein